MDHAGNVAVADQPDRRACAAHFFDQAGMARPVEDAGGDLRNRHALGLGQVTDVFHRRRIDIDDAVRIAGADGDLFHVDIGRVEQAALFGDRDDGQRIGQVLGADRGAFKRIERDVDFAGPSPVPTFSPI